MQSLGLASKREIFLDSKIVFASPLALGFLAIDTRLAIIMMMVCETLSVNVKYDIRSSTGSYSHRD